MRILYPRDPVRLGALDQEPHFPLSLDFLFPPPMIVRFNSAPLKRAFLQDIGDIVKEMVVSS